MYKSELLRKIIDSNNEHFIDNIRINIQHKYYIGLVQECECRFICLCFLRG